MCHNCLHTFMMTYRDKIESKYNENRRQIGFEREKMEESEFLKNNLVLQYYSELEVLIYLYVHQ